MKQQRVGPAMKARRNILKISMRAAAMRGEVSPSTWADLEGDKHPPTEATQLGVAKGLLWPDDWYDQLMEGTHWTALPQRPSSLDGDATQILARLVRAHRRLAEKVVELGELTGVDVTGLLDDVPDPGQVAL